MNFLIVDFDKTATDEMSFRHIIFSHCNDLAKCSWNNPFQLFMVRNPHHSMRLTTTCLSVCENCSIIPIKNTVHQGESTLFVDERLWGVCSKYFIEAETFWGLIIVISNEIDLIVIEINFDDICAT